MWSRGKSPFILICLFSILMKCFLTTWNHSWRSKSLGKHSSLCLLVGSNQFCGLSTSCFSKAEAFPSVRKYRPLKFVSTMASYHSFFLTDSEKFRASRALNQPHKNMFKRENVSYSLVIIVYQVTFLIVI